MSDDDKSGSVWAVAIVFAVLSWLTIGLRIYVRIDRLGQFGWDDKLVVLAQIFFTGYLICQMGGAAYGTGRKLYLIGNSSAEAALRFWFFCELWYSLAGTAVKISILLSLRRITVRWTHTVFIYGLMIWSISLGLAFFLGVCLQCRPTSDWWSLDPAKKNCLQPHVITALTYTVSAFNVACDWTLGLFPFLIVRDLSIPTYQKILVASILAFGAIASTATIVRMFYIPTLEQTYKGWNGEFLYDTTPVAIWSTVEVGVGITAICLSTLRPLVTQFIHYVWPSACDARSRSQGYVRRHSHASPLPLPQINPLTGIPDFGIDDRASREEYDGVSHFNVTKPIDVSITEADDDYFHSPSSSKIMNFPIAPTTNLNATNFNATKALTSSYGDSDDEGHAARSPFRRHGGPT